MHAQQFELVPPNKLVLLFPLFIGVVVPAAVVALVMMAASEAPELLYVAPALLIMPLVAGLLAWSIHRRTIELRDQYLVVRHVPWRRTAKLADLDLDQARIINLEEHPDLRPTFKIMGTSLPGYRSGLFWLRDRRRAYVLLTDRRRVLYLPMHDGSLLLLSPQRPEALLDALQRRRG